MYKKRLLIFLSICSFMIIVCLMRLSCMSLFQAGSARKRIEQMQILPPEQLPTIRGDILDRNSKVLAGDRALFYIEVTYELTKVLDQRYIEGTTLIAMGRSENQELTPQEVEDKVRKGLEEKYESLTKVIDAGALVKKCPREQIEEQVRKINDDIWKMRRFIAWSDNHENSELRQSYKKKGLYIPFSKAMEDYASLEPDRNTRIRQIMEVDLSVMKETVPLIELSTKEEKLDAQFNFADIPEVRIMPETKRVYPYEHSACQIIGWVGLAQPSEGKRFSNDAYSRYLSGEVAGKNGVELICEPVLRGLRGEVTYNRDGELLKSTKAEFGRDVVLSLDIELQRRIEDALTDPNLNTNYDVAMGAVVIDVISNEILALVSLPTYNLNTVRSKYNEIASAPNKPFENKGMYKTYPPGSSIKPFIYSIGIDERVISPDTVISCPHEKAPSGWPSCWIFRQNDNCHDWIWDGKGENKGRNAIRGSCNIYFSTVANKIEPRTMQKWLYNFGFGRKTLAAPRFDEILLDMDREDMTIGSLRESAGQISSSNQYNKIESLDDIKQLNNGEKRWFGIGQGNLRTTVLQVANAMAAIARGGVFKKPKLFIIENSEKDPEKEPDETVGVRPETLLLVRDGMRAVIAESGGTAYTHFSQGDLDKRDVTVYGKTGSTERPANAWFSGFAEDSHQRCITIAVVVEGGVSGSRDAAPLGRRMIELCNEMGYVGKNIAGEYSVR